MPPPIPPFEPQAGIALTTRPLEHIPPSTFQNAHWDPAQQYDLAVNTLPTEIPLTAPYYYPTAYSRIVPEKPSFIEPNGIEGNPTTSEWSSGMISPTQTNRNYVPYAVAPDPYHIPIPTTQMLAMAAETIVPYWEDGTTTHDRAYQRQISQDWWSGPHLRHVPVGKLWPLIVICILLLVVAAWLAVPGFPLRPF